MAQETHQNQRKNYAIVRSAACVFTRRRASLRSQSSLDSIADSTGRSTTAGMESRFTCGTVESHDDATHLVRHSRRPPHQRLRLRHPQHRRGGAEGRGSRPEGPLPEYRRPDHFRVPDAAAHDRGGRARDARRPQRLRAVGRHPGGARGGRRRVRAARHADDARSRRHHVGHIRRDRARADRAGRAGRRSADPGADVSALHRGAREDRRARGLLPDRSSDAAGSRTSITSAA